MSCRARRVEAVGRDDQRATTEPAALEIHRGDLVEPLLEMVEAGFLTEDVVPEAAEHLPLVLELADRAEYVHELVDGALRTS